MAAIDQPAGASLTIREAAAACGLSPRTIRRKLNAGRLPEHVQAPAPRRRDRRASGRSRSPTSRTAGLAPTMAAPDGHERLRPATRARRRRRRARPCSSSCGPTGSADCAPSSPKRSPPPRSRCSAPKPNVGAASPTSARPGARPRRHRAEGAHHRDEQRIHAIRRVGSARTSQEQAQAQAQGQAPGDIVAVPPLVRAEAMRYTATLQALHDLRKQQNRWWQFWRG